MRDITQSEVLAFEEDKLRFKSEELGNIHQNESVDVNLDSNYHVVKTTDWNFDKINESIIIRKYYTSDTKNGSIRAFVFYDR